VNRQELRDIYEQTKKRHANAGIAHAKALDDYNKAAMARAEAEANLFRSMTLEELEAQVARTQGRGQRHPACIPDRLIESLREEADEVCELLLEISSQGIAPDSWVKDLALELGDLLNVITAITMHAGFTLEEVAKANDKKLRERWPDGHPDTRGEQ